MPKVYKKRDKDIPADAVYVGRPTKWGDPYVIPNDGDRDTVVAKFAEMVFNNAVLMHLVKTELRGKDLVCWCAPLACHADVLLEIANRRCETCGELSCECDAWGV